MANSHKSPKSLGYGRHRINIGERQRLNVEQND